MEKMIMKKTLKYFALAAMCVIAFSCAKEEGVTPAAAPEQSAPAQDKVTPAEDGNLLTSFGVSFEGDAVQTAVSVNLASGETAIETDDEVLVFVDGSNNAIYKYDGSEFVLKAGETAVALGGPASVFYPADEYEVDGSSDVKFVMPAGSEGATFGDINPMVGVISGSAGTYSVVLSNIASVLSVKVSADVDINSVSLDYSSGVGYAEGAKFTVNASGITTTLADASANTSSTVVLGTPAHSANVVFLIPADVTLTKGLTVTANLAANHNGGAATFSVSNSGTAARSRNTIATMSFYAGLFSGGTGTELDPYKISTLRDFKNLQKYTVEGYTPGSKTAASFLGAYYQQTADITVGTMTPIGTSTAPFTGSYDGQDNELKSVSISTSTDNTGVFGYIQNATIKDLTVSGTVTSTGMYTGGIAGQMEASTISGCTNKADITNSKTTDGNSFSAGIVARATDTSSKVVSCINEGTITANKPFAGGIAGDMNGTIDMCINRGIIKGSSSNVGGITGSLRANSIVKRSYSAKWTDGKPYIKGSARVGGIVGVQNGEGSQVVNCMNRSLVKETSTSSIGVGGIVGVLTNGFVGNCLAGDSYVINTGDASSYVGMIVGYVNANGVVQNCYSRRVANNMGYFTNSDGSSTVTRKTSAAGNTTVMGQVYGYLNGGTAKDCYYRGHSNGVATGGSKSGSTKTNVTLVSTSTTTGFSDASYKVPVSITLSNGDTYSAETMMIWEILSVGANLIEGYTPAGDELMGWRYSGDNSDPAVPSELYRLGDDYYKN